jgi:hypothetical protein
MQITPHAQTSNRRLSYATPGVRAITASQPHFVHYTQQILEQQQN